MWLTRRNKLQQSGPIDPLLVFRGFVEARINVEYSHAQLRNDFASFQAAWCVEQAVMLMYKGGAHCIPDWSWLKGVLSFFLLFFLCVSLFLWFSVFCFLVCCFFAYKMICVRK